MIRPVTAEDAEAVAALIRTAFAELAGILSPAPSGLRVTAGEIRDHFAAGGGGAWEKDQGCILWSVCEGGLYLGRLAVVPACRGRGLARRLLEAGEAAARAQNLPRVHLAVRLALTDNRELFRRLGYIEGALHTHEGFDHPTYVSAEKWLL